jgi:arylsulfatase
MVPAVARAVRRVIPTPAMDRVAKAGLRYTIPLHRALLPRGADHRRNHHSVGFGVITEQSTGYPGYDDHRPEGADQRDPRENSYATSWFGKNHNTPGATSTASPGLRPVAGGHGLRVLLRLHGRRVRPVDAVPVPLTTQVFPWISQPQLITDMADDAIDYLNKLNAASPASPLSTFPGGAHRPARRRMDRAVQGKFDMGWNALRDRSSPAEEARHSANTSSRLGRTRCRSGHARPTTRRCSRARRGLRAYVAPGQGSAAWSGRRRPGKLDLAVIYIEGDNGTSAEARRSARPSTWRRSRASTCRCPTS